MIASCYAPMCNDPLASQKGLNWKKLLVFMSFSIKKNIETLQCAKTFACAKPEIWFWQFT